VEVGKNVAVGNKGKRAERESKRPPSQVAIKPQVPVDQHLLIISHNKGRKEMQEGESTGKLICRP